MTAPQNSKFRARLHPDLAAAWMVFGQGLDTRTAQRARQHAAAWRAAASLPAAAAVLVDVVEAQWHPALTLAAVHLLDAVHAADRRDNPTSARLARDATREVMGNWGELKAEGDLRGVGAQLGDLIDRYLATSPAPMLAQAWNELPLTDAFTATMTALTSKQPRTWTPGQAAAVLAAWDELREALPLPEASNTRLDAARRAAQIQRSLDVARMLLAAYPTSPPSTNPALTDLPPTKPGPTRPGSTNPEPTVAVTATPGGAFNAVRTAGALLSQLLGSHVVCGAGNRLVGHWTIDKPVINAWNCLRQTAHDQPAPRGQRAMWSAVRALTLPDAPMAAAVERYQHLDWRAASYYAGQVTDRAHRCTTVPRHTTGMNLPETAVEEGLPTDTLGPEPRAGPDLD